MAGQPLKPLNENDKECVRAGCWHPHSYHLSTGKCLISDCECEDFTDTRETMPSDRLRAEQRQQEREVPHSAFEPDGCHAPFGNSADHSL